MNDNIIEILELVSGYQDRLILKGVDLKIKRNEIFIILGGSGGGKTTLLKHIIGLLKPRSGDIKVFGKSIINLRENDFDKVLKRFGMLFQGGALINSMEVWENVAMPLLQHTDLPLDSIKEIVKQKLALVNLKHAYHLFPSELSGGMKKRVALARAIALEPEILFFDEPSAGLDPITAKQLDELILDLKEKLGMTIVVVTHELESIKRICDRLVFLIDGKSVFVGTMDEAKSFNHPFINEFFSW
ncbi:MAG: ABC transporter ATP-binding protein [Candidatus Delongbacteria bacterium]|nr:ABC transporter ATP-binding protein [Candidatus Delongbacteria bacterium]MBN2833759.1 ABC transporter ATP-binding protein [Candidatus Delongbacteria bacterium]